MDIQFPQFVSEEFEDFVATHGIQHRKSPPLWPQANGEVERQNRTLLKSLKVAEADGKKWNEEFNSKQNSRNLSSISA